MRIGFAVRRIELPCLSNPTSKRAGLAAICLAVTLPFAGPASLAAERHQPVTVKTPPKLHKSIAAWPRVVASSGDAAAARINAALTTLDKRFVAAAAQCGQFDAQRKVDVTLAGERFLSLVAQDSWYCGAYPDTETLALVYDLGSGRPVNWLALLPHAWTLQATADSTFDGTTIGMIKSQALSTAYWSYAKRGKDAGDCESVIVDQDVAYQAWPDAKADAVVLQPANLPHVVAVCASPVEVPTAKLRQMGASAALLDDIDAAHARLAL
jgi:hypothetical protein